MTSTAVQKRSTANFRDTKIPIEGETGEAVHTIVTGRKCWRILKGKDEAVWPPQLEAALVEGLEKYKPTESRSTRSLGRFPMRNKFISDHIFETTGKRRTPKQVGSRIQQLRDTNSGKQILKVYSDRHYEMMRPSKPAPSALSTREQSLEAAHSDLDSCSSPAIYANHVYIEVLPPYTSPSSSTLTPTSYLSRSAAAVNEVDDFRTLGPRPLRNIDPTVTFTSQNPVSCYSSFHVMKDGVPVHSEVTAVVECQPTASGSSSPPFMYRTSLVPRIWHQLCQSEEPESYTISQEIIPTSEMAPAHAGSDGPLSSVTYHFVNSAAAASRALSPNPSIDGSIHSDSLSSAGRTPDLGSDFDEFIMTGQGSVSVEDLIVASPCLQHPHPYSHQLHLQTSNMNKEPFSHLPDLLCYDDEDYSSFPSSPSEVSAMVDVTSWTSFDAEAAVAQTQNQAAVLPELEDFRVECDGGYFPAATVSFTPAPCFGETAISEMFF